MAKAKKAGASRVTGVTTESETTPADLVSMTEAFERLLPYCDDNPFEVAEWLDHHQRRGKIRLLGYDAEGGPQASPVVMAPNAGPTLLGVMARIAPDGKASLYVEVRRALDREYKNWAFDRLTFETHFPKPKNRGGRPKDFNVENLVIEALIYAAVEGLPRAVEGEGSLFEQLKRRLGSRCPERSRFHQIFDPIYRRIKDERDERDERRRPPRSTNRLAPG